MVLAWAIPTFKGGSAAETGKSLEKVAVKAMKASRYSQLAEHPIRFHPPKNPSCQVRVSRGKAERVRSVQADSLKVAAEIWYDPGEQTKTNR